MSKTDYTTRELSEIREIASRRQAMAIGHIPLPLQGLVNSVKAMFNHKLMRIDPGHAHSASCIECVAAHAEVAQHLSSRIAVAVDNVGKARREMTIRLSFRENRKSIMGCAQRLGPGANPIRLVQKI